MKNFIALQPIVKTKTTNSSEEWLKLSKNPVFVNIDEIISIYLHYGKTDGKLEVIFCGVKTKQPIFAYIPNEQLKQEFSYYTNDISEVVFALSTDEIKIFFPELSTYYINKFL